MIGTYGIDLDYIITEGQSFIDYKLKEFMGGRFPGQQFKLFVYCTTPREQNTHGNLSKSVCKLEVSGTSYTYNDSTHWIKV